MSELPVTRPLSDRLPKTERPPSPQQQQNEGNEDQRIQRQIENGKTAVRVTMGAKVSNETKSDRECKPKSRYACPSYFVKKEGPTHLADREASNSDQYANHAGPKPRLRGMEGSVLIGKEAIETVSKKREHTAADRDGLPCGFPYRSVFRFKRVSCSQVGVPCPSGQ